MTSSKSLQIRRPNSGQHVRCTNLKNDKLPSWVQVSNTGPPASREILRYWTVVTGYLLLPPLRKRWARDNAPVCESMLVEYIQPCMYSYLKRYYKKSSNGDGYLMYLQKSHLCITAENEVTSVIMVHGCNLIVKDQFINNPASAYLRENLIKDKSRLWSMKNSVQIWGFGLEMSVHISLKRILSLI